MKSIWNTLHKIGDILHLPEMPTWLVIILALTLILRIPSFFEPYYYGDEMIYMTLGTGARQGDVLYKDVHDNKPPLLYLTAALAGSLFWFKAILAFWCLATIFIFFKLASLLFQKNKGAVWISTVLFALLTTLPRLEGNIANAELFMIGPTMLAFYILLQDKLTTKNIFMAGVLFSVASLFKIPAAFEIPVIILYWVITKGLNSWKEIFKNSFVIGIGFATPILLTFVWYFFRGALSEYIAAAFLQNVGYVKSWTSRDVPMIIRAGIVAIGVLIIWLSKKNLSTRFIFLSLWTLFALFGVVLSGRPYPHYFIQVVAPMSLLIAMFFADRTLEQCLTVIPLALIFFVPNYYDFWFYPTVSYYQQFASFVSGKTDRVQYFSSFNENTDRNYQISSFLVMSSLKTDKVFMWDPDSSTVYALSRRLPPIKYVADYHINDFSTAEKTVDELKNNLPKFIILTDKHPLPEILPLINKEYLLIQQIKDASIYSRIGN